MIVDQFPDRVLVDDGIEYLYFGGTNYLGISTHADFQNILFESIKKWGTAYGSSRNSNIQLSVFERAEKLLAQQNGMQAALTVSSGMLAGKLILDYLSKSDLPFFHFPDAHPAIKQSNSQPIVVDGKLNSEIFNKNVSEITVTTDSIPAQHLTPIDLSVLLEIPSTTKINLVVDESHSMGLIDTSWRQYLHKENINMILVASLGKAYGLSGGMIAGSASFISEIRKLESFIGASGMNPAFLETYCNAQSVYHLQKRKLEANLKYIDSHFSNRELFSFIPSYPNIYFDETFISEKLLENKIIHTSFAYTNASGRLNRIVITANHTTADLDKLLLQLNSKW